MKPIATIHWLERGQVKSHECKNRHELATYEAYCRISQYVSWTCLTDIRPEHYPPKMPSHEFEGA